jgi:hypothetical protein
MAKTYPQLTPNPGFEKYLNDPDLVDPLRKIFRLQESSDPDRAVAATEFLATLVYGQSAKRFVLPACDTPAEIAIALDGLARAVAEGTLPRGDALAIKDILALKLAAREAAGVEERIEELQDQLAQHSPKNLRNAGLVLALPRK